jgi:hypothetical protein
MTAHRQSPTLALLPPELHKLITRHLPLHDLVRLSRSCHAYAYVANPAAVAQNLHSEHLYDAFIHAEKLGVRSVAVYEWFVENINPSDLDILGAAVRAAGRAGDLAAIRKCLPLGDPEKNYESVLKELASHGRLDIIHELCSIKELQIALAVDMAHLALWNRHYEVFRLLAEEHARLWNDYTRSVRFKEAIFAAQYGHWDVVEFVVDNCPKDLHGKVDLPTAAGRNISLCKQHIMAAKAALAIKNGNKQQFAEWFMECHRASFELYDLCAGYNNIEAMKMIDDHFAQEFNYKTALAIAVEKNHQEVFDYIVKTRRTKVNGDAYSKAIVLGRHAMAAEMSSSVSDDDVVEAIGALFKLNRRQEINEQFALCESRFRQSPLKYSLTRGRLLWLAIDSGSHEILCDLVARAHQADVFEFQCNKILSLVIKAGHARVVAKILQNGVAGLHIDVPTFEFVCHNWTIPTVQCVLLVVLKHTGLFSLLETTISYLCFKVRLKDALAGAIRVAVEEGFEFSEEHVARISAFIIDQNSQ